MKSNFDFDLIATWKNKETLKQNVKPIQMPVQMTVQRFSITKNPANYRNQETEINEQVCNDIRITDDIAALENN